MKVVHLCLACFFPDNYSYQENMLPKFHKQLGYDVEVIASLETFDCNGNFKYLKNPSVYYNEYGIKVTRLNYKKPYKVYKKLKRYIGIWDALDNASPDVLFIHGCQFMDIKLIAKYCDLHSNIKVYVDNHADSANSAQNWLSEYILHKIIWKSCAKSILPYVKKFYGVLPARVDFLHEMYDIPMRKIQLLVMGADDDIIKKYIDKKTIEETRKKYGILKNETLIVTGGKINKYRPETLNLMKSIIQLNDDNIKLLVFGAPSEEFKIEFNKLCENEHITYVGWANQTETYEYMSAADLILFPGLHSVMWEQAVALGKPCVFRDIEGFHHVDLGGNCKFINDVSVDGITKTLKNIIDNKSVLDCMRNIAETKGPEKFLYSRIAKESLE